MKGRHFIFALGISALIAPQASASVFSGSGGGSLKTIVKGTSYDFIDAVEYQSDVNRQLEGLMEFQALGSGNGVVDVNNLERRVADWGAMYQSPSATFGAREPLTLNGERSGGGFFIHKYEGSYDWEGDRQYAYTPINNGGAIEALIYSESSGDGVYGLAWDRGYDPQKRADHHYNDVFSRRSVHPAPEPATWVLLATGLIGLGIFVQTRRRENVL